MHARSWCLTKERRGRIGVRRGTGRAVASGLAALLWSSLGVSGAGEWREAKHAVTAAKVYARATSGRGRMIERASRPPAPGWIALGDRFALQLNAPSAAEPVWFGAAPRRLLLDRVRESTHVEAARVLLRSEGTGTGSGVFVGIVDSGIDFTHPDLRDSSGRSRVRWWLDFGVSPYGFYPELESEYGCDSESIRCGILSNVELQRLLRGERVTAPSGNRVTAPNDVLGHGTHVASLAVGNGASDARYAGMAPEAELIAVRIAQESVLVQDLDILLATRFVFERAEHEGWPAVVNLSLGGDIGPHDGSSGLARSLSDFVGAEHPGRAIVVAAGNSGGFASGSDAYVEPFGIHTDVHVAEGVVTRVPVLIPGSGSLDGTVFVWISVSDPAAIRVGLEDGQGRRALGFVSYGQARATTNGELDVVGFHHAETGNELTDSTQGIALVLDGMIPGGSAFGVLLEGSGHAELWVQSEGMLAPEAGLSGAMFPRATREGTISIPAESRNLLAVGATLNRTEWTSYGEPVEFLAFSEQLALEPDSVAFFSGAGPSFGGRLKPDLVAPGAFVVGAMAEAAQPIVEGRLNRSSVFGVAPYCSTPGCAAVDDEHAVTLGTSMASPVVAGAVALLLEADPRLNQTELRDLLQAGARRLDEQDPLQGAGLLDVATSVRALQQRDQEPVRTTPNPRTSWLTLARTFAVPSEQASFDALLHLRGQSTRDLSLVAEHELSVEVTQGRLTRSLERVAPGLYRFSLAARSGSGGERLRVEVFHRSTENQAELVASRSLPIAVDSSVRDSFVSARGGCTVGATRTSFASGMAWIVFGIVGVFWLRLGRRNADDSVQSGAR